MVEPVKIELTEEDVQKKTDSEKLTDLVKIAFANHAQLSRQGIILFGNGNPKESICYKVAFHTSLINWLWGAFSGVSVVVFGILVKHIMG
jgi:hypothetical protein